jgi:hypothetical protein
MRLVYALAFAGAALGGCDVLTYRPPLGRDFGAPYDVRENVVITLRTGLTLDTPTLDPTRRLVALVEYVGGCAEHAFTPTSVTDGNERTVLWLVHDDGGDTCERFVRDTLIVDLGDTAHPGALALATPGGDELVLDIAPGGGD